MKKCLIMLTSEYPYGIQESFIESEINHHADNFDKTIILAIDLNKDVTQARTIPDNADCYNIAQMNKKIGKIRDVALGSFCVFNPTKYYKSDKQEINNNIFNRIFHEYFCHRAKREYKYCMDILKKYDFSEYDKVVIYSYWFFVTAFIGTMLKEKIENVCPDVKLISRCHNYDVYGEMDAKRNLPIDDEYVPLRRYILERLDTLYPCSAHAEQYLKEKYPEFADKIKHSYLGTLDYGVSKNNKTKNSLNFVSCSQIIGRKRVEKIIEALELLDNSDIPIKWTHIGAGPQAQQITFLAKEKLKNIKFNFVGSIPNEEVYTKHLFENFDLLVNVSATEGIPVSIMEAVSFGVPIIATDVGGVKEIVKEDYNGKLLKKDFSPKELADLIKYFAAMDFEQIEKYRNNSRALWTNYYDSRENYSAFSKEISNL